MAGKSRRARKHLAMKVIAFDPYIAESRFQSLRVRQAETLDALLDVADVITVHTPLTDETRGMIGRRELARVSPQAIVVNMARGGIVDEEAIAEALRAGTVRAAAIDAFSAEPVPPIRRCVPIPDSISRRTWALRRLKRNVMLLLMRVPPCAMSCSTVSLAVR